MRNHIVVTVPERSRRRPLAGLSAFVLGAAMLVSLVPVSRVEAGTNVGTVCRSAGAVRDGLTCRSGRDGVLRWRRNTKTPVTNPGTDRPQEGVKVVDGLPFARTLPAGLTAREVAFQFAKDWTALRACLNWGPDDHNENFNGELGRVTSKCNKAVWGTPNAFNDWYVRGRLSNESYYGPVSVLWEKYTAYGALLRHTYCPESWGTRIVCEGHARGYSGWHEGRAFGHHLFYDAMRLTYAGETWHVNNIGGPARITSVRVWVDPANPSFDPRAAAQFAETPLSAEYWEYPGCKLLGRSTEEGGDSRRTCTVYWAYRDLSGNP